MAAMSLMSYSTNRMASRISVCCILGSVNLATDGSSNVSERNNSSSGNSTLGMASNVGGEPRKHGGDRGKDTAGSDGQTDIAGNGGRVFGDDQEDVSNAANKGGEGVVNSTLAEAIRAESKDNGEETGDNVCGGYIFK